MGTIFVVGADKGGTGKTTVARALGEYLEGKGVPFTSFDSEHPQGGLKRFRPSARVVNLETIDGQMEVFDDVSGNILIDTRAGMLSRLLGILDEVRLLDDVHTGAVNLAVLHVLGPTQQSLGEVLDVVAAIGRAQHFPVRNFVSGTADYLAWASDPRITAVLDQLSTLTVPHLEDKAAAIIDREGFTFSGYAGSAQSRMLRGKVERWLGSVWSEFDRVGIDKFVDKTGAT